MKIKILNKNLQTPNDFSSSKSFGVDEGSVFTETYNETLDNATVIISNIKETDRIEIEPYDVVQVLYDDGTFWKCMCVDTYTEKMICVKPRIYRYEISLFSETKLLEGIVLPSLKITKMPDITRSIYYYINQYLLEYCPEVRIESGDHYVFTKKFNWTWTESVNQEHFRLDIKFANQCPEMQWNTPTLREVLNDLMMANDCIVILKNGKIDYLDLTKIGNDVTNDNHINYVVRSKSSEDYVSELQVDLQNVTNEQTDNVMTTTRVEYVPFMTNETEVALKTSNAYVKTKYPIYKLKSLVMIFPGHYTMPDASSNRVDVYRWFEQDLCKITNFVTEYQKWITKPVLYNPAPFSEITLGDWQNFSIYYTRGTNRIDGFFGKAKQFPWMTVELFTGLEIAIIQSKYPSQGADASGSHHYQAMFKVEYETLEGCLFRASKGELPDNNRIVIDNQTNSMVDSYAQGSLEYQKANRLGNEQLQINARYDSDDSLIKISDVYEDTVIYQCQYQVYKDHIEVNAISTKNYILREYFTGVKSKIRSWVIASGSEALVRHDLSKFYCEFSWKYYDLYYTGNTLLNFYEGMSYLLSSASAYTAEPLTAVAIQNYSSRKSEIPDYYSVPDYENQTIADRYETYYCLDLVSRIVGNSIVLSYGFEDNFYLEKSIDTSIINLKNQSISDDGRIDWADTIDLGGVPLEQYSYTDDIGELDSCYATFISGLKLIPDLPDNDGGLYVDPVDGHFINPADDDRRQFQFYCYLRPRVVKESIVQYVDSYNNWDYRKIFNSYVRHKDSQEILKLSTQFEFCSETTDICFGKEWLKRQKMVNVNNNDIILGIGGYNTKLNFRKPNEFPFNEDRITDAEIGVTLSENINESYHMNLESPYVFDSSDEARQFFLSRRQFAWYLYVKSDDGGSTEYERGEEPILLAFTNIPAENIKTASTVIEGTTKYSVYIEIFLNILKVRDKNIYEQNNHYLINRKL